MFTYLIGQNTSLAAVDKICHLKNSLEGNAACLIANVKITGDAFAPNWDTVVAQYDNCLLISAQLHKLFNIQPADSSSAKQLNVILSVYHEAIEVLKALGSPTQHWDHILVHLITQKLDPALREV